MFRPSCKNICYRERFSENISKTRANAGGNCKKIAVFLKIWITFAKMETVGWFTGKFSRRFQCLNDLGGKVFIKNFCEISSKYTKLCENGKNTFSFLPPLMLNNVCVGIKRGIRKTYFYTHSVYCSSIHIFFFCIYTMEQYGVAFQVFRELVLSLLGKHFANTQQRTYKVATSFA
jgi:hypothetical protein